MSMWEPFVRVGRHPRTPTRARRKVRRIVSAPPIPSLAALTEDLGCTFCNAAPFEPCHGTLTPHIERQEAAMALRDRMLGR